MDPISLSKPQVRRFLLAYQNLWPPCRLQGKEAVLDFIRRVGCIQFDPLDVVGQNPNLVLQARLDDFTPSMLRELLYTDRQLLDGWDKQMSIYPVEDWPSLRRRRASISRELMSREAVRAVAPQVRASIEQRGPLSSIDLDLGRKVDWWWSPTSLARAALESMYFSGELIVHHKVHTRKVYDLAERHIPPALFETPDPHPGDTDYQEWYLLRRLGGVGLLWNRGGEIWAGVPLDSSGRQAAIQRLQAQGKVLPVQVEGITVPLYLRSQDRTLLEQTLANVSPTPRAAFLAPLDNLIWERRLINDLFGFDYRWEVYTPVKKRQYGYYVLPVLYGDRFVARIEPVRQKKDNLLMIKNWWWEPDVTPDDATFHAIRECLERFCTHLGLERILVDGSIQEPGKIDWLVKTGRSKLHDS